MLNSVAKPVLDFTSDQVQTKLQRKMRTEACFVRVKCFTYNVVNVWEWRMSLFILFCVLFIWCWWQLDGVSDLTNFALKINKHESSIKDKNNFISFKLLRKPNISANFTANNPPFLQTMKEWRKVYRFFPELKTFQNFVANVISLFLSIRKMKGPIKKRYF